MSVLGLHKKCGARTRTRVRNNGSLTPMYNCTAACLFARERNGERDEAEQPESEELDIINLFAQRDRNYLTH